MIIRSNKKTIVLVNSAHRVNAMDNQPNIKIEHK